MLTLNRFLLTAALTSAMVAPALAQEMKTDDQIGYRQATFKFLSLNMARLKANVQGEFNINDVKVAAQAIKAAAYTKPELLFGEGSDKSTKYKVEALPEVWLNHEKFVKASDNMRTAADALVVAVETGDKGKVTAAFGNVGKSCKACHDDFKGK